MQEFAREIFKRSEPKAFDADWPCNTTSRLSIRSRRTIYGAIEEVFYHGEPAPRFEFGNYSFDALKRAVDAFILWRENYLNNQAAFEPNKEFIRGRSRAERLADVGKILDAFRVSLKNKAAEILSRSGPWQEVLTSPDAQRVSGQELLAEEDLTARLKELALAPELFLCSLAATDPEFFDEVINGLPEGQSEAAVIGREKEEYNRRIENMRQEILEAKKFRASL